MKGWWDCDRMDQMFERVLTAKLEIKTHLNFSVATMVVAYLAAATLKSRNTGETIFRKRQQLPLPSIAYIAKNRKHGFCYISLLLVYL